MPLYSIDARSGLPKRNFEHSPRIWIITDVTDVRSIPRELRAIVPDERRIIRDLSEWSRLRGSSDSAAIVWFAGDRFLEGTASSLLRSLHSENRRSFVVVNTPCVEEIPYLTVQPRMFANAATVDYWSLRTRIESGGTPSARTMVDSTRPVEPWVQLVEAISSEKRAPGTGVEPLLRLWESRDKLPGIVGALVPRNLVAVMLQHQESANARKFLEAGAKLYPTYAELHYLAALLAIREHCLGEAPSLLERAKSCGVTFPGSGGENSYRSDWLLGVLAVKIGDGRSAFQRFLAGVKSNPLFEPSLTELLKLHLPRSLIENHQYVFARAARLNPHVAERISEYLSTHGVGDAARRIKETIPLDRSQQARMENQRSSTASIGMAAHHAFERNSQCTVRQTAGVVFDGPFFEYSSLARVNRAIATALLASDEFEVCLEPSAPVVYPARVLPDGTNLTEATGRSLHQISLTIRHHWPPNFRRPQMGKLGVILPWEYGGVPRVWIEQIQENVDELWVPSNFVREVFVQNGVDAERVAVVPNGYDPKVFNPEGPRFRPQGSRDFVFLFVGGAIQRKGIDLLLHAYNTALSADDNVTLVLLVSGSSGAYQHNSLIADIRAAAADPTRAHVLPMFETVDDSMLANLYRGADAFVLPYRGEGFGMPLLEAMACGKAVITTAEGPAGDFCELSNSYLVHARTEIVPDEPPPLGPIEGLFTWFEPSFPELFRTLRHVYQNRQEAAAKGKAAAKSVRHLTWENATKQYAARIRRLCGV